MYQITKVHRSEKFGKGERIYKVYTQQEADDLKLDYIHWKEVDEETPRLSWILSDDGYVAELIEFRVMSDKYRPKMPPSHSLYLPYTKAMYRSDAPSVKMEFMPHWEKQNFSYYNPERTWEDDMKGVRWKWFANAYAIMIVNGSPLDYNALGRILRPKYKNPGYYARRKLKNEKVEKMCMEALDKLLERKGAGREKAIEYILKAGDFAMTSKNAKDMLAVGKTLAEMNGMEPAKVTKTEEIDGDFEKMLDKGSVKGTISGKRTTESVETTDD